MTRAALLLVAACGAAPVAPVAQPAPAKPAPVVVGSTQSAGNVHGRVELDGKPVTYFGVSYSGSFATGFEWKRPQEVHSSDGSFAVVVPRGKWDLVIVAPDVARQLIAGVEVTDNLNLGTISLRHGHTVTGVVRDAAGEPVPNARVDVVTQRPFGPSSPLEYQALGNATTQTGPDGHYELHGISRTPLAIGPAHVMASLPDGRAALPAPVPDADATIDLQVVPTGAIIVTVDGGSPQYVVAASNGAHYIGNDTDGSYHFDHLPEATYTVTAEGPSRARQTVTVHAGTTETVTLSLPVPAPVGVEVRSTRGTCTKIELRGMAGAVIATAQCSGRLAKFPGVTPNDYEACVDNLPCSTINVDDNGPQQFDVPR